ncbi:MAG: type 1 glutamine amidotransferase [Calditrichaeota bacterium]|nr:MAG: type 1 glutamine amidotransferase [Calditrichota bacterium]
MSASPGRSVALLVEDWFEDLEFWYPYYRLQEAGYQTVVVGPEVRSYRGKHGLAAKATLAADRTSAASFAGLFIPGGYAPDRMRRSPALVALVREVHALNRPIAAICHGGWMLISAGLVRGRRLTSFFSIRVDLENAGARWVDEPVVVDGNLVTAQKPDDLPQLCPMFIELLNRENDRS